MSNEINCRLCGQLGQSAKAHVVPDGFFAAIKQQFVKANGAEARIMYVVDLDDPDRVQEAQSAEWDRTILCQRCEETFAPLDRYAIQVFRDEIVSPRLVKANGISCLHYDGIDQVKLQKFFMFLAWRVGASNRPSFRSIDLGGQLPILADSLLKDELPQPNCFPVLVKKLAGSAIVTDIDGRSVALDARGFAHGARLVQFNNRLALKIALGCHVAYIGVDGQVAIDTWARYSVGSGESMLVIERPLDASPELREILNA